MGRGAYFKRYLKWKLSHYKNVSAACIIFFKSKIFYSKLFRDFKKKLLIRMMTIRVFLYYIYLLNLAAANK